MDHKFQVGDIVRGNHKAKRYGVTGMGSIGIVVSTDRNNYDWSINGLLNDHCYPENLSDHEKEREWSYGLHDADFIICLISNSDDIAGDLPSIMDNSVFTVCSECFDLVENVLANHCDAGDDVGLSTFIDEF